MNHAQNKLHFYDGLFLAKITILSQIVDIEPVWYSRCMTMTISKGQMQCSPYHSLCCNTHLLHSVEHTGTHEDITLLPWIASCRFRFDTRCLSSGHSQMQGIISNVCVEVGCGSIHFWVCSQAECGHVDQGVEVRRQFNILTRLQEKITTCKRIVVKNVFQFLFILYKNSVVILCGYTSFLIIKFLSVTNPKGKLISYQSN